VFPDSKGQDICCGCRLEVLQANHTWQVEELPCCSPLAEQIEQQLLAAQAEVHGCTYV